MHLPATAGATPSKIADSASISDVHALPGGVLLYLANVDGTGTTGDAFKAARDGSGATPLGTGVPVGFLEVTRPKDLTSTSWVSAHLTNAAEDKNKHLVDGIRAIVGELEVTTATASTKLDATPMTRIGQFQISDDLQTLVWATSAAFDMTVDNFVGNLTFAPVATPTMQPMKPVLAGVSEVGPVVGKQLFVNAPKASTPGVYFVDLSAAK